MRTKTSLDKWIIKLDRTINSHHYRQSSSFPLKRYMRLIKSNQLHLTGRGSDHPLYKLIKERTLKYIKKYYYEQ